MRLKSCKRCGAAFETEKRGAYLCPACALASRRSSVLRERICADCGVSFTGYPKSKRCPDCQRAADRARSAAIKRNGAARPLGSIDQCKCCGADYVVESGLQKYCKSCAKNAVSENVRGHKRQYMQDHSAEFAPAKAENRSFNKICVICGKVFDSGLPTVTCSDECAKELRRRRQNESDLKRGKRKADPLWSLAENGVPKSGIPGITWHSGKWQLKIRGKYHGLFRTVEEAKIAKEKAEAEE